MQQPNRLAIVVTSAAALLLLTHCARQEAIQEDEPVGASPPFVPVDRADDPDEVANVQTRFDEALEKLAGWKERWLDADGNLVGTEYARARSELEAISKGYKDTPAGKEAAELMALLPQGTPREP